MPESNQGVLIETVIKDDPRDVYYALNAKVSEIGHKLESYHKDSQIAHSDAKRSAEQADKAIELVAKAVRDQASFFDSQKETTNQILQLKTQLITLSDKIDGYTHRNSSKAEKKDVEEISERVSRKVDKQNFEELKDRVDRMKLDIDNVEKDTASLIEHKTLIDDEIKRKRDNRDNIIRGLFLAGFMALAGIIWKVSVDYEIRHANQVNEKSNKQIK